jgi:pantothenate kinase
MQSSSDAPMNLPTLYLSRVEALLDSGQRSILGIVAPPGAGKSTLAQALAAQYPDRVQVVPMDGFHLANSELLRLGRSGRKGAPDTFDAAGYAHLLQRLSQQGEREVVYAPDYRREIEEAVAGAIAVLPATRLIVTEGNYLLLDDSPWPRVREQIDEVWYLDVDQALRRERLLQRHMFFGRSRERALSWIASTDEPNAVRLRLRARGGFLAKVTLDAAHQRVGQLRPDTGRC